MSHALLMFLAFIVVTLGITYWAAKRTSGAGSYFAANRQISAWQNGVAVAGDYMSAASFLGIAGLIAFFGYDGFMYSVGWLVAYLTVLLVIAEPLRNAGKYTMAGVLAYCMRHTPAHPRPRRNSDRYIAAQPLLQPKRPDGSSSLGRQSPPRDESGGSRFVAGTQI